MLEGDTPDTLAARVFEAECDAYPEAIWLFMDERLEIESDRWWIGEQVLFDPLGVKK